MFAPGTKHNVREFMFVQCICSGSRWRFRALATGVYSLFCTTGFADVVRCLLLNRSVASQVVQLVDRVILAHLCVKFHVHFGSILGPFWDHFGSILGPFWVHFGTIFAYCLSGDASFN